MKPRLQKRRKREAVLRGLSERAVFAREFRSGIERSAARVRKQALNRAMRRCLLSLEYRLGDSDPIERGRHDATGIACPLAARIYALHMRRHERMRITYDTHRRGATRLDSRE